jgi:UbiD family decarboxylase
MREYLSVLEAKGKLRRISKSVDPAWEVSCIARWMYQAFADEDRFGLFFENVQGFDIPVMTGVLGASRDTYAIALEAEPDEINAKWVSALRNPISPEETDGAPCQEVILTGADVDLGILPIPVWTPEKDPAPYVSCTTISRDHNTGVQNTAVYRAMVKDKNHLTVNLAPGRHGTLCYESYVKAGKPAPFAWVIGAEPAVNLSAVANVQYGIDEISIAGGLKGEPISVVKASTVDLLVPAHAEFIIEGEVSPIDMDAEGPFGEFAGYMGPAGKRPVVTVTTITHRRNPIYYGFISQMPPSESTVIQSSGYAGLILKMLRYDLGYRTVKDVHVDLTYGGMLGHGIISLKSQYPGHAIRVGRAVANETTLKRITVVDDDIDIRDPMHLDWALNSRMNPARDVIIIDNIFARLDPSVRVRGREVEMSSKLLIDATDKSGRSDFSLPPKTMMMKALRSWKESGLPDFKVPKRTRYILDR